MPNDKKSTFQNARHTQRRKLVNDHWDYRSQCNFKRFVGICKSEIPMVKHGNITSVIPLFLIVNKMGN